MVDEQVLTLTAEIVAAHVANNKVAANEVANLISLTFDALTKLGAAEPEAEAEAMPDHVPATTVRKSLSDPNRIISMIDGKPYASLLRHLRAHEITPAEYRQRYGLKPDYPMVAPGYSARRREISMQLGLGRKPRADAAAPAPRKRAGGERQQKKAVGQPGGNTVESGE